MKIGEWFCVFLVCSLEMFAANEDEKKSAARAAAAPPVNKEAAKVQQSTGANSQANNQKTSAPANKSATETRQPPEHSNTPNVPKPVPNQELGPSKGAVEGVAEKAPDDPKTPAANSANSQSSGNALEANTGINGATNRAYDRTKERVPFPGDLKSLKMPYYIQVPPAQTENTSIDERCRRRN